MYTSTIITALLSSLALTAALPTNFPSTVSARQSDSTYFGVSIAVVVSAGTDPDKVEEPAPVQINVLTPCYGDDDDTGCSASSLIIQDGTASNVDINSIECRGFQDFDGVVPGSAPFTLASPALIRYVPS
jgi:hypothetical protein